MAYLRDTFARRQADCLEEATRVAVEETHAETVRAVAASMEDMER
jgi:hypothetical protein